jgi:hypothetical protein
MTHRAILVDVFPDQLHQCSEVLDRKAKLRHNTVTQAVLTYFTTYLTCHPMSTPLVDLRPPRNDEEDDDEALFAELEEEIENDSNALMREQGLLKMRQE